MLNQQMSVQQMAPAQGDTLPFGKISGDTATQKEANQTMRKPIEPTLRQAAVEKLQSGDIIEAMLGWWREKDETALECFCLEDRRSLFDSLCVVTAQLKHLVQEHRRIPPQTIAARLAAVLPEVVMTAKKVTAAYLDPGASRGPEIP